MFNKRISYVPQAWQDSSFAHGPKVKPRTGFVILMCAVVVAWGSKLQHIVALSTMEAEYMALWIISQEVMLLQNLLSNLSRVLPHPTMMMLDNKGYISFATNVMMISISKHINVKMHFVRDAIRDKYMCIQWCSTRDMLADNLTNSSIYGDQHSRLALRMMLVYFSFSKALVQISDI